MTKFITTSKEAIQATGTTAAECLAAAHRDLGADCPWLDTLKTTPCTDALYHMVDEWGGAISWRYLPDGTACTVDEAA